MALGAGEASSVVCRHETEVVVVVVEGLKERRWGTVLKVPYVVVDVAGGLGAGEASLVVRRHSKEVACNMKVKAKDLFQAELAVAPLVGLRSE